jgi:ubiquinone/menaquinone biosynthesis C-methylase UbiE
MNGQLQRRVQRYGWDKAVHDYEPGWRDQLEPAQSMMLEMAALAPGEQVLDVACGTGLVSFRALDAVGDQGSVMGTDISAEMVASCRRRARARSAPNISFSRIDAESEGVIGGPFTAALCALGLMYFPDPQKALTAMRRQLYPGGRAAAVVWGARANCGWADIFPITDARVASDVCPMFFQLGTGDSLAQAFARAGFEGIRARRIDVLLHYASADEALSAAFRGGPVALAYNRFDDETRSAVHEEYLCSIEPYRHGEGYRIPGEFVAAAGVTPS